MPCGYGCVTGVTGVTGLKGQTLPEGEGVLRVTGVCYGGVLRAEEDEDC